MNKIAEIKFFERLTTRKNDQETKSEENANSSSPKIISLEEIKKEMQDFKKFLLSNINVSEKPEQQQFPHLKSS
jgi:hypothetical protein